MKKLAKTIFFGVAVLTWIGLALWLLMGDQLERKLKEGQAEIAGSVADRYIASQSAPLDPAAEVKTVAGLHHIEIEVDTFGNDIYRARGVANSYLIKTPAGNVLFDAGLATQAAKQKRLLQDAAPGDMAYIVLSHSHADHIGATKFWREEFPEAKVITHRLFGEGQRYLTELQQHFWNRNRLLYTFMPEAPSEPGSMFAYGGITPDILVDDHAEYRFEVGGVEFVVLPTPGAEGDDNIVLWLPAQKALFTGDVFGPLFPMVPNLFTLRGEKFRDPIKYINSLNTMIALEPEIILPSHFDPVEGHQRLVTDMSRMRDATRYIHDETVKGMNAGRSVWELMQEIKLPEELALSQGHGKVSWDVRSIWEYYSTWFKFESTTELYPVPVNTVYAEIAAMTAGAEALVEKAREKLAQSKPVEALHFLEIALAQSPELRSAFEVRLQTLNMLLDQAKTNGGNFSELGWLNSRIAAMQATLEEMQG